MKPTSTRYAIEVHPGRELKSRSQNPERDSDVIVSRTTRQVTEDGRIEKTIVFSRLRADQVNTLPQLRKARKIDSNHQTVSHFRQLLRNNGMNDEAIDKVQEKISFSDQQAVRKARELRQVMQRIQNDERGVRTDENTAPQKTLTKSLSMKNLKQAGAALQQKASTALAPKEPDLMSANLFEFYSQKLIQKGSLQKVRPALPETPSSAGTRRKMKPLPKPPQGLAPAKIQAHSTSTGTSSTSSSTSSSRLNARPAAHRAPREMPDLPELPDDR